MKVGENIVKHPKYLAALLVLILVAPAAMAQDTKIGILNPLRALFASDAAQVIQEELEAELQPDQERLTELSEELAALAEQFQQNEAVMTEEEKRRMNSNAQDLQVQLQLIQERVQNALNERNQEFLESMQSQLADAVSEVVAAGGFDLILNADSAPYFAPVLDITARVTAKLNEMAESE